MNTVPSEPTRRLRISAALVEELVSSELTELSQMIRSIRSCGRIMLVLDPPPRLSQL